MALENYGTIWVCSNCLHHHANGECGDCHSDHGHDSEPLSAIEWPFTVAMGIGREDHGWNCEGDLEDCDCETRDFSTSQCDGCNSWLHGERHAMTLFRETSNG